MHLSMTSFRFMVRRGARYRMGRSHTRWRCQPHLDPEAAVVGTDATNPSAVSPILDVAHEASRDQVAPGLLPSLVVAVDRGWECHHILLAHPLPWRSTVQHIAVGERWQVSLG